MKRRVAVFTVVWAYTVNALWVPGGLDGGYLYSVFAPAWHLFALGALVGVAHESLANRLPQLWVTPAVGAALFEAALALFANHLIGLWLAVPAAIATALAARAARSPKLTSHRALPWIARGLAIFVGLALLNRATCGSLLWRNTEQTISPSGALRLSTSYFTGFDGGTTDLTITPRNDIFSLFGRPVHQGSAKFRSWSKQDIVELDGFNPDGSINRYLSVQVKVYRTRHEKND